MGWIWWRRGKVIDIDIGENVGIIWWSYCILMLLRWWVVRIYVNWWGDMMVVFVDIRIVYNVVIIWIKVIMWFGFYYLNVIVIWFERYKRFNRGNMCGKLLLVRILGRGSVDIVFCFYYSFFDLLLLFEFLKLKLFFMLSNFVSYMCWW